MSYLLKIIAGPNQGAEIALTDPELSIGSSEDCDLILSDALLSNLHLTLFVDGDALSLTAKSVCYINGEEIEALDTPTAFNPFDFISLGTTHIVIGDSKAKWPNLSAADIPELKKKAPPPEATEDSAEGDATDDAAKETKDPESKAEAGDTQKKEEDAPGATLAVPAFTEKLITFAQSRRNVRYVIGGLVALTLLFSVLTIVNSRPDVPKRPDALEETISATLKKFTAPNLIEITPIENDRIHLRTWVETEEERNSIKTALRPYSYWVETEIYSQEYINERAQELFDVNKLSLHTESPQPGILRVEGYVGSQNLWKRTQNALLDEAPGIRELIEQVVGPEETLEIFNYVLQDFGLAEFINIAPHSHAIIAQGALPEDLIPVWEQARNSFWNRIGFVLPIQNQVIKTTPESIFLDINIQSVHINDRGWVVTADGQKVFEGGILAHGYTIDSITAESILLRRDDERITLKIGD